MIDWRPFPLRGSSARSQQSMAQGMATARASGTTTTKTREIGTSLRARDDTSVQFMALSKKLTRGSYSGSVAGSDRSESRDLLGGAEQNRVLGVKNCVCRRRSMNTAIGACMETGMDGYIAIITGRVPAMVRYLQGRELYSWRGNRRQFR